MKILSWNVNGIRAIERKGFLEWLSSESPDILCLQVTKANAAQLSQDLLQPSGYHVFWSSPERKGYSGVATFTKEKPIAVRHDLGINRFDIEGRMLLTEYAGFMFTFSRSPRVFSAA